jgi:hypothetical protein
MEPWLEDYVPFRYAPASLLPEILLLDPLLAPFYSALLVPFYSAVDIGCERRADGIK